MTTTPDDLFPELLAARFGLVDARHIFEPGGLDPSWLTPAALRALPGRTIRWATGAAGARALACVLEDTEPGDLIVVVDDLETADRWYFAILDALGQPRPWTVRPEKPRGYGIEADGAVVFLDRRRRPIYRIASRADGGTRTRLRGDERFEFAQAWW